MTVWPYVRMTVWLCREETSLTPDRGILESKEKQLKKLNEKIKTIEREHETVLEVRSLSLFDTRVTSVNPPMTWSLIRWYSSSFCESTNDWRDYITLIDWLIDLLQVKERERVRAEKLEAEKVSWRQKMDQLEADLKHALKMSDSKVGGPISDEFNFFLTNMLQGQRISDQ